jgi:UDP-2,4-diacetamido-2,4,6-trideoxy-beta-L-altropyranose hydrolase
MNLLFRTDASVAIGTGHAMRCLALAQAWQDAGAQAVFALAESTASIDERLRSETFEVLPVSCVDGTREDANQTIALAQAQRAEWIVVDGYQFDAEYQRALNDAGLKILFLDDYGHATHYSADLVLNQNVCANEALYADRESYTQLLLGPRYCLLRREFAVWHDWKREVSPACHRLLIMMGGSDPENLTARVITAIERAKHEGPDALDVTVVVGGSNPHSSGLQSLAARSQQKISVRRDVSNMGELMAAADIAVSAAGSTCWELCLLALPALLIDVAPNQTALAEDLDRKRCAVHIGNQTVSAQEIAHQLERLLGSHQLRRSLSERSRELVDGNGSSRVVSVMRGTDSCGKLGLRLRRALPDDIRLLWEWANDPETRAASFSSGPISWETHSGWFGKKMADDKSLILIAENEKATPWGQIRFDVRADGDWEVDVSIAPTMRGRGLASWLVKHGVQALLNHRHPLRVHALVRRANVASAKAFERAGFKRIGTEQIAGDSALHFIYDKSDPLNS